MSSIPKKPMRKNNLALKQHFTDAKQIRTMMCHLLGNADGLTLLEPSVGHGAFLEGLIGNPREVHVVDVDPEAIRTVKSNFKRLRIKAFKDDFIDLFVKGLVTRTHPIRSTFYDAVISNPPYGLYFDLNYRKRIKRAFPESYARESYGLFLTFAVSQLKRGGRYVFLVPDTFLSSVNHRPLRSLLCSQAAPTHILRFPSKLFETVNFGYGNLCIVAGQRRALASSDTIRWLDIFDGGLSLSLDALDNAQDVAGGTLIGNAKQGWCTAMLGRSPQPDVMWLSLGEVAECRTGIYTGNNERFLGYDAARITRRTNGHSIDWDKKVLEAPLDSVQRALGIEGERCYVPLIRGGHREPFDKTAWAIDWSRRAIDFYRTDRKARLQNSSFYFRSGLSVPMVTTKRISAALMEGAVFDQGVVGVFPYRNQESNALLLYLNSRLASEKMKALVNGSANNSANYLKRLPVPEFSERDLERAASVVDEARRTGSIAPSACDEYIQSVFHNYHDR